MSDGAETPCVLAVDGVDVLRYVAGMQERPVADHAVALVATSAVVNAVFDQLPGHWFTSEDDELLDALLAAGARPVRYSHVYGLHLDGRSQPEAGWSQPLWRIGPIDRNGIDLTPLSRRAYPPEHVDHDVGDDLETAQVLQALLDGGLVGEYLGHASALALVDDEAAGLDSAPGGSVVGVCIINRSAGSLPDGGPWVTEIFRNPDPRFAGVGRDLLRHAIDRLTASGESTLGLAVTDGNPARNTYQALGFEWLLARRKIEIPESSGPGPI